MSAKIRRTIITSLASPLLLLGGCDHLPLDAGGPSEVGSPGGGGGRFRLTIENVAPWDLLDSGAVGAGPLAPGDAFEIDVEAGHGHALSFATMLGESNDWFFAPGEGGLALYDASGAPRSGDVTAELALWDVGSEIDQEPAVGPDTAPNQLGPDQGAADPDPWVRQLGATVTLSDGTPFDLPAIDEMVRATLIAHPDRAFTLRIENVSDETTLVTSVGCQAIHLSPAAWAVHAGEAPLFTAGTPDRGEGLAAIAEDGATAMLAASLEARTGFATPLSPGVVVRSTHGRPLFELWQPERGRGLERIAEDGDPTTLAASLAASPPDGVVASAAFDTPAGAAGPGPARPGEAYEIELEAAPGDRLSFATMFGMSNDWFFATPSAGLALFESDGSPRAGDLSAELYLFDAGTEVDQAIAIGPDTAPQQSAPDTGAADPSAFVRRVTPERYAVPTEAHVRVTLTPVR